MYLLRNARERGLLIYEKPLVMDLFPLICGSWPFLNVLVLKLVLPTSGHAL